MAVAAPPRNWSHSVPRLPQVDWALWRALVRYEFLIPWRSRLGVALLVVGLAGGLIAGFGAGLGPSLAAYRAWRLGVLLVGFAALPLMAVAARLDALSLAADGVESRPQPALPRLLARLLGNLLFILAVYAALLLAAWLAQLVLGGPLPPGSGGRLSLGAPVHAFLAGLPALLYVSTLAYCVTVLCPNLLSVAIVALYWLLILLGRDYLSRIFDFTLTQNAPPYLLLALGLLALTMLLTRWRARVVRGLSRPLLVAAVVLLLAGLGTARVLVLARHDPPFHPKPVAQAMAGQSIRGGVLPGFWLPDQRGRRTGLHDLAGGPLLVVFWAPSSREATEALALAQHLYEQYADRGLRVVGICLADDWSVARRFARERGYRFPMLADTGCHWADKLDDSSPLAEAYELLALPSFFVADASRHVVGSHAGLATGLAAQLQAEVATLLPRSATGVAPGG